MSAAEFVTAARTHLGVRWRHRGRKPWALDCLGLLVVSAAAVGLTVDVPTQYGREPWDDLLRKGLQDHFGDPVPDWRPGDIALIRWGKGEPSHVAIITDHLDGLGMIHVDNFNGVVEHALSGPYISYVEAVYRPSWLE